MKNTKFKYVTLLTTLFTVASSTSGFATGCTKSNPSCYGKSTEEKIKDKIDDIAESFKAEVDRLGEDVAAVQRYLDNYHWKGIIQDTASSKGVTVKHLQLNGHSKAVVARPGERIDASVLCDLDRKQCSPLTMYRVVVGIKGQGAQTTIGNELGMVAGESMEKFSLIAPTKPGVYQVRFKLVESLREDKALKAWVDDQGNEPSGTSTIGIILVKA